MNKFLYFIGLVIIICSVIGMFSFSKYEIVQNVKSGKQQCVINSNGDVSIVWKEICN
jgi:archaellum component FlaG (FlaF/FlaG flagellin family)